MIANSIGGKISEALKKGDKVRLSTLRLLSSAFNYEKIAKQHDLTEEEEIAVIKKEAKKRLDAIEFLKKAQSGHSTSSEDELKLKILKEEEELGILKEFLPEEISDEDLSQMVEAAISETGAKSMQDMGRVIGEIMKKAQGRADGKKVSEMVRNKLS